MTTKQEQTVFIVTFEGPGSGGFNWFFNQNDAQANYESECQIYSEYNEKTRLALFEMIVPEGLDSDEITHHLDYHDDVYGASDSADTVCIVGRT